LQRSHDRQNLSETDGIVPVLTGEQIVHFQELVKQVQIDESLRKFIAQITAKTRNHNAIYLGASHELQ